MITPPSTNNNDSYNYAHGSPHSPHTAPDPMVQAQPEYSQQHSISSPSSDYQHLDSSSSSATTNSPHTATLQYDSPNPNPQLGQVQLDFIPLPTTRPSAPPQPSTVPLPYVAPPTLAPSPSSVPYPVPPPSANTQQQQPQYENITFVDATPIDMSNEKYKMSAAAGGSTLIQDLRNPKKKAFWIFNIIALAIIFGVLGATVWKPNSNKNDPGDSNKTRDASTVTSSTSGPVPSKPVAQTPVTMSVTPTPVTVPVVPTPVTNPPPPPPQSTGGGSKQDIWYACRLVCSATKDKCDANCRATDSAYQSCNSGCNGDSKCEWECRISNGCFRGCSDAWGSCARECPSPLKRK